MFDFYKNKNVFVTGHTGFKGSWLCQMLVMSGANVTGYALEPDEESLFNLSGIENKIKSVIGDIRDMQSLQVAFNEASPEIVFHLAAQPLVRTSYEVPQYTYETNVMGTVNLLECIHLSKSVKSFINITTDKVYENTDDAHPFVEDEKLCGFDPYSNSKSCSELVTYSYYNSFLKEKNVAVSTVRAGNVIGGGDFAKDRIVPDCIRAWEKHETIVLRNPNSTRPFQHVLEPLGAYLLLAQKQYENPNLSGNYNVGPNEDSCISVKELCDIFCRYTNCSYSSPISNGPHEAKFLTLNCDKIKRVLNWHPTWSAEEAIKRTIEFVKEREETSAETIMKKQIFEYIATAGKIYD